MLTRTNKGQSILEYAILLAVIIAALLIMQSLVKRGYQGGLKDAADKMGEQYSVGKTTISQTRNMTGDQQIMEETAVNDTYVSKYLPTGIVSNDLKNLQQTGYEAYSLSTRTGGKMTSNVTSTTEGAKNETTRIEDYN